MNNHQYDPTGGDGFIRGEWRQVENALLAGLITDEEYERIAMTHDDLCYRSHDQPLGRDPFCQCSALVKAREDERSNNFTPDDFSDAMTEAYQRGLNDAREAVELIPAPYKVVGVPRHVVAEIEDKAYIEGYKEAEAATLNAILRIIDRNKHEGSCCFVIHTCDIIQEIDMIRETTEDL